MIEIKEWIPENDLIGTRDAIDEIVNIGMRDIVVRLNMLDKALVALEIDGNKLPRLVVGALVEQSKNREFLREIVGIALKAAVENGELRFFPDSPKKEK